MAVLTQGVNAPDFSLPSSEGEEFRLSEHRGHWVVLYFYPKDMTPGCTTEACEFRDVQGKFREMGAVVVGVSADPVSRHQVFKEKYHLNFPLLADEDHAVAKAYGAFGEKKFMGKTFEGVLRTTYLIDPEGKVSRVWTNVKAKGHAAHVLEALRQQLQGQ